MFAGVTGWCGVANLLRIMLWNRHAIERSCDVARNYPRHACFRRLIGLVFGLVGSGGLILAIPLLVYVVGIASPHAGSARPRLR
jgi:hypothetical protein